jgi:ribosomal protein S18 acetylase RimI-like enzyme
MEDFKIMSAKKGDERQLKKWFKGYAIPKLINTRVDCYIHHNHTLVAKSGKNIVGVLQWLIKEDPKMGISEFEEIFVNESYRNKGIASMLILEAIKDVKKEFTKLGLKPRKIFLFVSKGTPAVRLYEKYGFKFVANLGNTFSDNNEELFYTFNI